jgi:hypothetical protein
MTGGAIATERRRCRRTCQTHFQSARHRTRARRATRFYRWHSISSARVAGAVASPPRRAGELWRIGRRRGPAGSRSRRRIRRGPKPAGISYPVSSGNPGDGRDWRLSVGPGSQTRNPCLGRGSSVLKAFDGPAVIQSGPAGEYCQIHCARQGCEPNLATSCGGNYTTIVVYQEWPRLCRFSTIHAKQTFMKPFPMRRLSAAGLAVAAISVWDPANAITRGHPPRF